MADKHKPELPDNAITRAATGILRFTDKLQKRRPKRDESEAVYGDITNRLFAFALDLFILVIPITIITNIVIAIFLGTYQYDETIAKIHDSVPPETFEKLSTDAVAMNQHIIANYPSDYMVILNQMFFVRGLQIALIGIYVILMTWRYGATLGKMFLGLKVVDKITGGKLGLAQTAIRFIGYFVAVPFGLLHGAMRKDKRTWHDYMADTVVIFTPNRWYKRLLQNTSSRVRKYLNNKN